MMKVAYGVRRNLAERGTVQALFAFLAVCVTVLALSAVGLTQELAATLTGTVTDPSGAVVAGVTVVVHSNDTGADVRSVTTSSTGSFNITNLPAGRYTVTVKNEGFQTYVANDVILNVAEKHTLDIGLKTGKVSETLEVTAENTPIQTTSAEQSGTVTGDQVRELALNNRNFEQLVLLQPGVANQLGDEPGFGLSSNTSISINGARMGANNWTVDGADINDSGSNGTLLNTPSIDAIQEFTLERSNYDASFGRSGGGQVVVATKSGTNQFHGSAYEFNRNNYYNANTFENRQSIDTAIAGGATAAAAYAANEVPIERYNDWGFTIGGPIEIPKVFQPVKDKTYFFWSEEWRHSSLPGSTEINVPTTAELGGVFTTPINVAPAGCVTAAGGTYTISPSCYSQNAKAYLNAFMVQNPPNVGTNLLDESYSELNNFRQDIIRLDQNAGDKVRIFGRYMQDSVPENFPFGLWGTANYPGSDAISLNAPGRNLVANATVNISPKVVNEVEFADSWGAINAALSGFANSPAFTSQLTGKTAYQDPYGRAPNVEISGYTGLTNGNGPYFERNIDKNIFDNLSIQQGNHTIRLGLTAMWMTKTENATSGEATFNFGSAVNGNNPFANFLLGQADSYSQPSKDTVPDLHYTNFEFYVQDDWKVTPRLTLNIGVRYSYFPSPTDAKDTLLNFDPLAYNPANAPTIVTSPGAPNGQFAAGGNAAIYANGLIFPTGATCAAATAIAPTATCSPYGARVNPSSNNNWGPRLGLAYDPLGNGKWAIRAGYGLFYDRTLNGIWEQNAFDDPPLVQTTSVTNNGTSSLNLFDNYQVGAAPPAPLGPSGLVTTGANGVGQAPTFRPPSYQDFNLSVQHEIMPNTVAEIAYVGTTGTHLLGDIDYNQPTVATRLASPGVGVNAIAPFLGYTAITSRDPVFTSNYNSLQATLNRRLSHGLQIGIAYTWSKLLGTNYEDRGSAAYNTYDLKENYGLSTTNTPQMVSINYVYQEPYFKERNALGWMLGGWELSGIITIQSGQSLTVSQANDPWALVTTTNSTQACTIGGTTTSCPLYPGGLGIGPSTIAPRPNQIGSSKGPKTVGEFFNTAAFSNAVGQFGTAAPGSVLGPGYQRWDTSLFKNLKFGERVNFQLRLETFNTFNHGSPNSVDVGVDDAAFGQVNGYHIPRNVQIGGKLTF
jgi:Carboxypeptidase regulatory-like domain/TonB-dependent Receptor Plug Domain